ncbi:MAG: choice-of-anchor N protein [Thermogutta sp.]
MRKSAVIAAIGLVLCLHSLALAYPVLQIYLEGGNYNSDTESWYLAPPGSSAGQPFRLWVLGNTSWKGPFHQVRLSMAYNAEYRTYDESGAIIRDLLVTITPSTTDGLHGFLDPSTPSDPSFLQNGDAGTVPVLGDGTLLPAHGIFGPNTVWQEWLLGDFTLQDSPMGDFIGNVPPPDTNTMGQINVYEVSISFSDGQSAHGVWVHFDAYNHVEGKNHVWYRFAPFSHDADGDVTVIPEPGNLAALAGMLVSFGLPWGISLLRRRRAAA